MIGLDTNVLLRALLDDDPEQSLTARKLLQGLEPGRAGFVSVPVLMEFFWVLRTRYGLPRTRLVAVLHSLLETEHLEFEALQTVGKALSAYHDGRADFADLVISLRNQELGAEITYTFDKVAAKSVSGMELLA